MKKIFTLIFLTILSFTLFAETIVAEKDLGKTLEKNKNPSEVFVSELDLNRMRIDGDGVITIPLFEKSKLKIVSGMDMTNISERIAFAKKKLSVTFEAKDLSSKTYAIVNIGGIETVAEYRERIAEQQRKDALKNIVKQPVQVVIQETTNLEKAESAWLPGQIQDKLRSNLQNYLGMKIVVDSKSEGLLKKLQSESESSAHDEKSSIEIGKITSAKFAIFTKLRKTDTGYTITVDFTDLTTGEQILSIASKEYSKAQYLYGSTGAVDEITLSIGNKLEINISDLNRNYLTSGSSSLSLDEQMSLARQNEEHFKKQMESYDAELNKLMSSKDINAVQNKNRIEAEKALLLEKQNAEKKRLQEIFDQKKRADEDAKFEAERSIALKNQRDQMAKDAAEKAALVRKMKLESQGVIGQINVLESKKKALIEIRKGVEERYKDLYVQLNKDREVEQKKIIERPLGTSEKDANGKQTEQSKRRRELQLIKNYESMSNNFFNDCESVKMAAMPQQEALLSEILADQNSLARKKTVSSMGDELKVSFGRFDGGKNGWVSYLSLYSDGILIYTDTFIMSYEAVSGKKVPTEQELVDFSVANEYDNNIDMYNSLLTRGDPIVYFEIDYYVNSLQNPSEYEFNFKNLRVIETISGNITQSCVLKKTQIRKMTPVLDIEEKDGIVAVEKALLKEFLNLTHTDSYEESKKTVETLRPYLLEGKSIYQAYGAHSRKLDRIKFLENEIAALDVKIRTLQNEIWKKEEVWDKLYQQYKSAERKSVGGVFTDFLGFSDGASEKYDKESQRYEANMNKINADLKKDKEKLNALETDRRQYSYELKNLKVQ